MLVVDDDAVIRQLMRLNLELDGYEVVAAEDGEQALGLLASNDVDVVTLDVMMPRLDGWSACERLRADPALAWLPVVLVSARSQGEDRRRGEQAGADRYLTKPFDPEALVATVAEAVTLGRERRGVGAG